MTDKPQDVDACRAELTQIRDYLQNCETRLHQGEVIDLSSLGSQIEKLCLAIQNMPISEAQPLLTELEEVINMLDKVEDEIMSKLDPADEA